MADLPPSVAMEAVLMPSCELPEDMPKIRGYDFNQGVDLHAVMKSYITTGFQASSLGLAIQEINTMVRGMAVLRRLSYRKNMFRDICLCDLSSRFETTEVNGVFLVGLTVQKKKIHQVVFIEIKWKHLCFLTFLGGIICQSRDRKCGER